MTLGKILWTTEGLLADKNDDGVIDGVSIFVDLPENLMPLGLLDFFARMGLETTALSYNFFENNGQQVTMGFEKSTDATEAHFEGSRLTCFYESEEELSQLLAQLAAGGQEERATEEGPKSSIRSLSDIWSYSGFGSFDEASPHHELSLNIDVDSALLTPALFRELCHFAARCALYSTALELPLTGNEEASISFRIKQGEETELKLLGDNRFELAGSVNSCPLALHTLNSSKHWSQEGEFGYWEQEMIVNDKTEAELWYETEWEDRSEREQVLAAIEDTGQLPGNRLEVFLSEPLTARKNFEKDLLSEFPDVEKAVVRSAFKAGFHWIREELLPNLDPDCTGLHISVRKEANKGGLELPIRWIQELYPIDSITEKETHLTADAVTFSLHDEQDSTYRVEALFEGGRREALGTLEVPIAKMPYITRNKFAYPSTGAVRLYQDEEAVREMPVATDRERFYLYYLQEFLPDLQRKLAEFNPGQGHDRPFFDRIEIDVTMSEEEEKLFVDEERTSPLEALYEDLYFNTLDFFANWGMEESGKPFDAPGGIHPFMHIHEGEHPSAAIRVYRWDDRKPLQPKTTRIHFEDSGEFISATISGDGNEATMPVRKQGIELPANYLVSGNAVIAEHSYKGLPIPVLEYYIKSGEAFDAPIKLTLFKKTVVIETGHHANEISSTPAVLRLMENAERYTRDLNIVVIPNSNPDGFGLLQKMIDEHPEWKHHAARYNAVGLEFAHVRYKPTIFGEANVLPLVMKKWAPDIVVDDHGIPAHEWVQPFAGYNSPPRFPVSYFLPSAKIYGIGQVSNGANKELHQSNLEALVQSISSKIADTAIAEQNEYWKQRFTKYGHHWLPDAFPIEEAPHLNFYRQQTVTPEYPTVSILRYPEWVAADVISEAADEVVYGDSLESCIEAHVLFNQGVLELLQKQQTTPLGSGLAKYRERPIQFKL
ncbi:M14 family metallopeptidase [Planococcus sp. N028]|uniref:M14 family metallopeptidase n=1 Tax=Planococcus shixiaomingii TaxID=3058393 RepID=A0ABT8N2Y0_9BACL|nr:M14 family metallopeptidase [Planococcus sp. N028]MDN7242250.1 M14 family metallopeptidase [Planococcus sp. N028]